MARIGNYFGDVKTYLDEIYLMNEKLDNLDIAEILEKPTTVLLDELNDNMDEIDA
jgi:hypothetical protein